jgi:glycosyltransferase involved in cell wall biosynthesis
MTVGIFLTDPFRAAHFRYGNIIACVSPKAADSYRRLCRFYGGQNMARRVRVIPHAVESRFLFSGYTKRRHVTCVGRWQDTKQKRPWLLTNVIEALVASDHEVSVTIVGTLTKELAEWYRNLSTSHRDHIHLHGYAERNDLVKILNESQVFFSPSAFESFGIAAAEALCSGCSIVAQRSVSMASFDWFISEDSGTLTDGNSVSDYVLAIQRELSLWKIDERSAQKISSIWCQRLHADKVAAFALDLYNEQELTK